MYPEIIDGIRSKCSGLYENKAPLTKRKREKRKKKYLKEKELYYVCFNRDNMEMILSTQEQEEDL